MAERSKKINFYNEEKIKEFNKDTMKYLNKYKIDMSIRELSEKTIYNYEMDLYNWFTYILDKQFNQCITELNEDDIMEFLYFCKQQGNNSRRMKRRMASISAFYKFLRKKRIIKENPMEFIDRPRKDTDVVTQTFLTKDQVEQIKRKLKEHGDIQLETYVLLSLSTMARVNAISNIKWEQIDFENRIISDVLEKEGKIVDLYFNKEVKELLLQLQSIRKENNIDSEYVFISKYNKGYSNVNTSTLSKWTKKVGEMIGVPTLHCHDWRHSGATLLKNAGMPIERVSSLLHHEGLDVTKKFYIKEDTQKMINEKDKYELI
ncbi:tyrosine-type recombinase/integrase [Clostridium botulinum C]|uniref:Recombinase XerD n=2 Tax=Clostridium botulinum TaxID=1491 RepID=A0A9Q4TNQ9_CLOBO|nr:tyrosine-type recombinase/integrase [Clostridium botulinum]YP_398534.1 tyrosine-type recombinase/integrase [Clostridium phage c-st]MCD3194852.1 tyrosine-type recombinase/integrase [Clostridium botulinum C]MCD3200213.1 tyrosine-type recombinase/integrase [Clostridium botulinum C]MCD3205720.1 tyrosine-type recombinase/integrase [Clostridium botulinum C]MCD3207445.1 tyrosine-type recombinase/integrase [Clostridium botulinum C]MCD3226179.1 tyrosine-type recombinase/integrase [Clostridium botul